MNYQIKRTRVPFNVGVITQVELPATFEILDIHLDPVQEGGLIVIYKDAWGSQPSHTGVYRLLTLVENGEFNITDDDPSMRMVGKFNIPYDQRYHGQTYYVFQVGEAQ